MRSVALLACFAILCGVAGAASTPPSVRSVAGAPPLTLRGTAFAPLEQLTLDVVAVRSTTVPLRASVRGVFTRRIAVPDVPCVVWRATVVRHSGRPVTARGPAVDCRPESGLTDTAPLRGTGVAGVVLRSDPATGPAPGAEVRVESSGVALVRLQTGADGRFAAYVPPGAYTIRVPNHPEGAARVTVTRGRLAHVSLAIEAGGR